MLISLSKSLREDESRRLHLLSYRKQKWCAPLRGLRVLDEMKLCHPDLAQNPGKLPRRYGQDGESGGDLNQFGDTHVFLLWMDQFDLLRCTMERMTEWSQDLPLRG